MPQASEGRAATGGLEHFVEMAETWELLAKQREEMLAKREQENQLAQTVALAESIANDRGPTTYPKKAA
jgi:hypothetical protein